MQRLKEGIINIGGLDISAKTNRYEFLEVFDVVPVYTSNGNYNPLTNKSDLTYTVYELDKQELDGMEFAVRITFANDLPSVIELVPYLPETEARHDVRGYAVEKWLAYVKDVRSQLDKWLKDLYGEPDVTDKRGTVYIFGDIKVSTFSQIDTNTYGMMGVVGGSVVIKFPNLDVIPFNNNEENKENNQSPSEQTGRTDQSNPELPHEPNANDQETNSSDSTSNLADESHDTTDEETEDGKELEGVSEG